MAPVTITERELVEAVQAALASVPVEEETTDGFTVLELSAAMKVGQHPARAMVRRLAQIGMIEIVDVRRRALDGRLMRVKGYRIKKPDAS
jgi:Mn-dependent DtxR family transcriptional regulator